MPQTRRLVGNQRNQARRPAAWRKVARTAGDSRSSTERSAATTFRGDAALSSWIYRITFNAAMSRLRTAKYQRSRIDDVPALMIDGEETPNPSLEIADWSDMADERLYRTQLRQRIFSAILALPAIYRAPVMLRDIQGMSTEEASAMLRVKDQTLKSRLHRGRLILRKQLSEFAGGLTLHHATA